MKRGVGEAGWHGWIFGAVLVTALGLLAISIYRVSTAPGDPENRPIQLAGGEYVSSNACESCHPGNYRSWHASYHRTMTQVANTSTIQADMNGLELRHAGKRYVTERQGDRYLVRQGPEDGELGPPQQLVLVTGSHTLQIPWLATEHGRTLEQLPFAYIIAEKMWAPVTQTFLIPPDIKEAPSLGAWNGACMDCHVTQGRSLFVEGNRWNTDVAEFGIACEACHSNGAAHVAANRSPVRRWKLHLTNAADPTIANPSRMNGPASALACGQCHSVWAFKGMDEKLDFNRKGGDYRPGQDDLGQRFVAQPNTPDHVAQKEFIRQTDPDFFKNRFWGDGMVRVTGREYNGVAESPCFRGQEFSCLSCHEMHPARVTQAKLTTWRDDQLKAGMDGDQACLQCHKQFAADITAHTHHAPESSGSRCYNCHMPHTTFGLLKSIRSHQVSSPTVRESTEFGRPNACNLCHLDKTLAWTGEKLQAWFNQTSPELAEEDKKVAASVKWIVKGDAAQRAMIAWGMGWKPAHEATGNVQFLYPFLIYSMTDPYAAIRFNGWKSLQSLPGFADFKFTYTAPDQILQEAARTAYQKWWREVRDPSVPFAPETILDPTGAFQQDLLQGLRAERDNSPVLLAE